MGAVKLLLRVALIWLGMLICAGSLPASANTAVQDFEKGTDALGRREFVEARRLYGKSCDGGFAHGYVFAGEILAMGEGGAPDLVVARTLFAKACRLSMKQACLP
jgi:TPR repeat protein